jgi:hypothetical protein
MLDRWVVALCLGRWKKPRRSPPSQSKVRAADREEAASACRGEKLSADQFDAKGARRRLPSAKLWAATLLTNSLCLMSTTTGMGDSLYHHRRRTTNPRRNPGRNPYTRPNPRRTTNPRRDPTPRRKPTLSMLSARPTDWATPREPPPGRAAAVRVEPAVAIVRAAKPIAILRMMMSIVLSTPASRIQLERFGMSCSRAAQSRGVSRNQKGPGRDPHRQRNLWLGHAAFAQQDQLNAPPRRSVRPPPTVPSADGEAFLRPIADPSNFRVTENSKYA